MSFMKKIKRISAFLIGILMCISAAGCKSNKAKEYIIPNELSAVDASVLAQNDNYELKWDNNAGCVMLIDKKDGSIWSTTPYNTYMEQNDSIALNSAVSIEYYDLSDSSMQSDKSYNCVMEGSVSSKQIDGGICVTYYFSVAEVTVPVYFTLEENGIRVTVKAKEIIESGKTKLISVSLAPYLCSTANKQDESSYLLIPTGSGALMYTDDELNKSSRDYSGEVYGTDASRMRLDVTANEEHITLPVFGAKTADDTALFAVIESGAESARIDASAGSMRYGYSNAYATFYVRGFDEIEQIIGSWRADAMALAETWSKTAEYSVCYYPLKGENSDYSGMASFYRNYLEEKGLLKKSGLEQKKIQLEIVGGALTKKFFLGIPYESVVPLTTLNQAQDIINEISLKTDKNLNVLLNGYGSEGADVGKIGGGFDFSSVLGSNKEYSAIDKYCKSNSINLFNDYELIYFNKSGNGFTELFDTAKTANLQKASISPLKINIRMPDEDAKKASMLKRNLLEDAIEELIDNTDGFSGVGLGSLGYTAYSDYSDESSYMKAGTELQVSKLVNVVKKSGKNVILRSANAYCAGLADSVCDVALDNGGYNAFDVSVPFYQMIYAGSIPLYSTPLNFSSDTRATLLKAIESGVAPNWCVIKSHNSEINSENGEFYYAMEYDALKDEILSIAKETEDYYSQIAGTSILKHELLSRGISKTVFENGVTVYVNHTSNKVNVQGNTIDSKSYLIDS